MTGSSAAFMTGQILVSFHPIFLPHSVDKLKQSPHSPSFLEKHGLTVAVPEKKTVISSRQSLSVRQTKGSPFVRIEEAPEAQGKTAAFPSRRPRVQALLFCQPKSKEGDGAGPWCDSLHFAWEGVLQKTIRSLASIVLYVVGTFYPFCPNPCSHFCCYGFL